MSPSKSKSQQAFFGMLYDAKRKGKQLSGKAGKTEKEMSIKSLKDFATTSTKGLPKKTKKGK